MFRADSSRDASLRGHFIFGIIVLIYLSGSKGDKMRWKLFLVAAAFLLTSCGKEPDLAAIVKEKFGASNVILNVDNKFKDSFRSPNDSGTTYIVTANITDKANRTTIRRLRIFVADSDGWTSVRNF
jgi:hypothetical protein